MNNEKKKVGDNHVGSRLESRKVYERVERVSWR